jgi:thiol:disulfide interchange protein DsbA
MRYLNKLLGAFALAAFASFASASTEHPQNNVDYLTLPQALPTDTGNKVEVIEFFAYYCPHCNEFEPHLQAWVKKQGDNIVFKRVHVPRDQNVLPQQRLFYTLEALGLLEQYHQKVFDAMHKDQRLRLNRDEQVFDWAQQNGIDREKFMDAYRSFAVQAKVRRAASMMQMYYVQYWPMVVVGGKYITSPSQAREGMKGEPGSTEQHMAALKVMDYLVEKSKPAAAASAK